MRYTGYYSDVKQAVDVDRASLPEITSRPKCTDSAMIEQVASYLEGGRQLGQPLGWSLDAFARDVRTPLGNFTDGVWVWPGDAAYYCRTYGILPADLDFLELVKVCAGACPEASAEELDAVAAQWYGTPK